MAGRELTSQEVVRWTRVGMLAALAMLLGYAETFVPIPIPGVKLGLANIPVLAALAQRDRTGAAGIAAIKVLATGLLFGSPLTLAYSAAGTLLALAGMIPLSYLRTLQLWMLSIVGALLHVVGQLAVAHTVLGTATIWHALPWLMLAGCVTGALCGVLAQRLRRAMPADEDAAIVGAPPEPTAPPRATKLAFCALVLCVVVVFRLEGLMALGVAAGVLALAFPRAFARSLRLTLAMGLLTLVLQLMVQPATALTVAGCATLRLSATATACMAFMQLVPQDDLPGLVAWTLLPLGRLGVRTQGFALAFSVALQLLPSLTTLFKDKRFSLHDLPSLPTELVQEMWQKTKDRP